MIRVPPLRAIVIATSTPLEKPNHVKGGIYTVKFFFCFIYLMNGDKIEDEKIM